MGMFLLAFALMLVSCAGDEQIKNEVVRVGTSVLTEEDLSLASVFTQESRLSYINNWANVELLFHAASDAGLDKDLLLEKQIKRYRKRLVGQAFLETKILGGVSVSEEEIKDYYLRNKEAFKRLKKEAVINSFVLTNKKEASRVRANLEKEETHKRRYEMFDKYNVVSETVSDGDLNPTINKKVFSANKNKYIGPIGLGGFYSVIEVLKHHEKGTYLGLDRVYDKVYLLIYKRKAAILTQVVIDSLKHEYLYEVKTKI